MDNKKKNRKKPVRSKRRKRRGITANQFIILMAAVVGIILVFVVNKIMQNQYLKVTKINSEYTLGTPFDIKNYIQPKNGKATVECDKADFQPDKVGAYKVKYTVKCGKLKKHDTVTIEIVDHDFPEITGPENLGVLKGETIDLLQYYDVRDSEPELAKKLTIDKEVDTSEGGYTEYTLHVIDWGNNSASKTITIGVFEFSDDMKAVALAVREYNREYKKAVTEAVYYQADASDGGGYVLVGDNVIYKVTADDSCAKVDDDTDLAISIKNNGTQMSINGLAYFNYNEQ